MVSPSTQRQQHYVSRTIQGNLLKQFATDWLFHFLLLWHGLFVLRLFDIGIAEANADTHLPLWVRYLAFCQSHAHLAMCGFSFFPLFFWNALRLSHRIAGPLERFGVALDALRRGEQVKPLVLRRDDLLVDFQRAFNRYLGHLDEEARSMGRLPKSARAKSDSVCAPETDPLIRELESLQAEIHQATTDSHSSDR